MTYPFHDGSPEARHAALYTDRVLDDVKQHRAEQRHRYGTNEDLEDGTGAGVRWMLPLSFCRAGVVEKMLRHDYGRRVKPTWMHLVREEVAEAFQESDPVRLREELIQVAALCVSWVEVLDRRGG